MSKMQDAWREYREKVYPGEIPAVQNQECHQAFFAGAMALRVELINIAELPENEAIAALGGLDFEIKEILKGHIQT